MKARSLVVFALVMAVLWAGLGSYGLVEPSDARYAEIAREMKTTGDYLFPRLLGISHFHKPPLIFWLSSIGYEVFGVNEWGARAPLALCGLALAVVVWMLAARLVGAAAAPWAALLLVTTPAVIAGSRILTTDLLLAVCQAIMLGTWFSLYAAAPPRGARFTLYCAAGLAFLAKGPVAWIVPALIVVIYRVLDKRGKKRPTGYWGARWGLPLTLAIALPWYLYVAARTPGLIDYFIGEQLLSRVSTEGLGHPRPWYFFALLFPALGIPWIFYARDGWRSLKAGRESLALFLSVWAVVPPLFFSLPSTKLPLYPLSAYPAIVLLAASALREGSETKALAPRLAGSVFLLLGAGAAVAALSPAAGKSGDLMVRASGSMAGSLFTLAVICLAGGTASLIYSVRQHRKAALALAVTVLVLPVWFFAAQGNLPLRSVRKVGLAAREILKDDDIFVEYRALASGLPFYAGRMPMLAWIPRDVRFDGPEVERRVVTMHEMQQIWSGRPRVVVVTRDRHLVDLPGARKIAEGGGYVLAVSH